MINSLINFQQFFSQHPLTHDRQIAAWGRLAWWQVRSRLKREIIVPWVGGLSLAAHRGMSGATGNIYAGLHEYCDMFFLLHFLRQGDLFFDVGSNIGSYSLLASGICGAESWAFEPDPETARHLHRNIEINDLKRLILVHETALGDANGIARFTRGLDTINHIAAPGETDLREVRIQRIDSFAHTRCPNMMKLDVEGHEEAAICGALKTISCPALKAIELETLTPAILAILEVSNFTRMYYDPRARQLTLEDNQLRSSNALFVRDIDFVRQRLAAAPAVKILKQRI